MEFLRSFLPHIPNTLTSVRIVVAAVIGYFALLEYLHWGPQAASDIFYANRIAALVLYLVFACPSDAIDGAIARKYGWVSSTGEWLDPLADKVLAVAILAYAWVMFRNSMHEVVYFVLFAPTVLFIAIYSCITTALRMSGSVGAASKAAQLKTLVQMVAMGFFVVAGSIEHMAPTASAVLLYTGIPILIVSAGLCVISLRGYLGVAANPARTRA
jgi:CDP-diacylglycerol---glycerol-3-phosphate 3-phosphatidyltransferase